MFGGPFKSAGVARIIGGKKYRYTYVTFAHWVNLTTDYNHIDLTCEGKKIGSVRDDEALEIFFSCLAAGDSPTIALAQAEIRARIARESRGDARPAIANVNSWSCTGRAEL